MSSEEAITGFVILVLLIGTFSLLFELPSAQAIEPSTIEVPGDYATIQAAITASSPGDTVLVRAGTYRENVIVNKSISLLGEGSANTIIDGGGSGSVITVLASDVHVSGFTVRNGDKGLMLTGYMYYDPYVSYIANCSVSQNIIANVIDGISVLDSSSSNHITMNQISANMTGIDIDNDQQWTVGNNLIYGNMIYGKAGYPSSEGIILEAGLGNNVSANGVFNLGIGISLDLGRDSGFTSRDNSIANNRIMNNSYGISLYGADDNKVTGNEISSNALAGIILTGSDARQYGRYFCENNVVYANNITANGSGIRFEAASLNTIEKNYITNNAFGISLDVVEDHFYDPVVYWASYSNNIIENDILGNQVGIDIRNSSGNSIYHNKIIRNVQQIHTINSTDTWDNGYPSGGNYWSDSNGIDRYSGIYQNETGKDGICDFPIHGDNYPLVGVLRANPLASFTVSPSTGVQVNGVITFDASGSINQDGDIVSYEWDFGDGNRTSTALPVILHAYLLPNTYHVTLMEINDKGLTDDYTLNVNVQKLNSSVSISVDRAIVTVREGAVIQGTLMPLRPQANVAIWYKYGFEDWAFLSNAATDSDSKYSLSWVPSRTGDYQLKTTWTGDQYTLPSESALVSFGCLNITSSITVSASSSTAYLGYTVNVTGTLRDEYGKALAEENIAMFYTFSGAPSWVPVTSGETDSKGAYSISWLPPAAGDFLIKAEWNGNSTHSRTDNTVGLSSCAYNNNVFLVESNSTIQGLTFDYQKQLLTFSVNGPDRSSGYASVTVAKSLVPFINALKIKVDGVVHGYAVDDLNASWELTFTYNHSVHSVVVELGGDWWIYAAVAVAAITVIFGIFVVVRQRKPRRVLDQRIWTGSKAPWPNNSLRR